MSVPTIKYQELQTSELEEIRMSVEAELANRRLLQNAAAEVEDLQRRVLTAEGRQDGAAWVKPVGAHDAYPKDWTVTHNGRTWQSLTPSNVWEPGAEGSDAYWVDVNAESEAVDDPTAGVPAWEPGRLYGNGQQVAYQGKVYQVVQTHAAQQDWKPDQVPALYQPVSQGGEQ